jgi:hypothetical protein
MKSVVPTREDARWGYRISEAAPYMGVFPWFVELKVRSSKLPALKLIHDALKFGRRRSACAARKLSRVIRLDQPRWAGCGRDRRKKK